MELIVVKNIDQGIERAKEVLYDIVDRKTALFLSGGKTPAPLYAAIAKEQILTPAAVGMVDERYGEPMHENSNEKMVQGTGLLRYLESQNIPFYPMLHEHLDVEQSAREYDSLTRKLFFGLPKSVAILGIGTDGHTASIMPNRRDFTDPLFEKEYQHQYVAYIDDPKKYGKRITLTFEALSLMDRLLVFAFGKDKKKALKEIFEPGPINKIPARFLLQPEVAHKTLFLTDQKI